MNIRAEIETQAERAPEVQVAIVGLGYIGLPTAAVLAGFGWKVCGVDVSQRVVETVNSGEVHIEERDLDRMVAEAVKSGRFRASQEMVSANFYLIAVPTPLAPDRSPDIAFVEAATRSIAPKLEHGCCIILESTSPVGTTERVSEIIAEMRPDLIVPRFASSEPADIAIAYCPERVLPGKIVTELVSNDRVIGGITPRCAKSAAGFYRSFVKGKCIETNARSAEMVKLTENAFRDVNIAFANELSILAEEIGIDVWEVIDLANRHPRVNILQPGPGVGGHCIAVDPWFLVAAAPQKAKLIRAAREVNLAKAQHSADRIRGLLMTEPEAKIALLGLAFKPDIDDFRESPALEIALQLASEFGSRMLIVEPFARELPEGLAQAGAKLCPLDAALCEAEIVAVLVDHKAFGHLDMAALSGKLVYDTRGMLR